MQQTALKCPVCAAAFRGVEICPRCGTDLQPLMRIAARAWALRQKSRTQLQTGDLAGALKCAALAWQLQRQADQAGL
jgi:predicted amidophosphoribosyltransferase